MGLCIDLDKKHGVEIRRESICLHEDDETKDTDIFAYGDHHVEISKKALKKFIQFFNKPENQKYLEEKS
jgi:hypothetical protein